MSNQEFIEANAPLAMEQQRRYGIPASVTLAQMILESGWGKSSLAREANNYFGIKCSNSWLAAGKEYTLRNDDKPNEKFCVFASPEASMEYHSKLLMGARYSRCHQYSPTDHENWIKGIKAAGYASDPRYVEKVEAFIRTHDLAKYDHAAAQSSGQSPQRSSRPASYTFPLSGDLIVTSGFGHRHAPTSGASSMHNGLDLSASRGAPVVSTEAGVVVAVKGDMTEHDSQAVRKGKGNGGGNYVVVEYNRPNGESYRVSYCHLTENGVAVEKGQQVQAGTVLGYAGSTGVSTGPHLHFTVKEIKDGKAEVIDPSRYLAGLAVLGGLDRQVRRKSDGADLLAAYKPMYETARIQSEMALVPSPDELHPVKDDSVETTKKDLLSALLSEEESARQGQSMIESILSGMFMGALTIAMQLDHGDFSNNVENEAESVLSLPARLQEQESERVIARMREGVDANQLRQTASMNYSVEMPEQSRENAMRLS